MSGEPSGENRSRATRCWAILTCATVIAALLAGCGGGPRPSNGRFGIAEPPWLIYENGGHNAYVQRLDLMLQLGASWLRIDFPPDKIGNPEYNDIYNEATLRYFKIIAIANAPYPSDTGGYVTNLLHTYPRIVAIEMGNEPNLGLAGTTGFVGNPAAYAATLGAAYNAKEHINPGVALITGGLACWGPGDPNALVDLHVPYWWMKGMYDSPAAKMWKAVRNHYPWDAIGYHVYADWSSNLVNGQPAATGIGVLSVHSLSLVYGDNGSVWNTEAGYSTQVSGPSANLNTAAQWLLDYGNWWRQQPWTGPYLYYSLDVPPGPGREGGFGLINPNNGNPNGSAKRPTFFAFELLAHA